MIELSLTSPLNGRFHGKRGRATIYTIYKETGSKKWTAVAALLPLAMGFVVTFFVAQIWRLFTGG
jgi:hypothetical protein